MRPEQAAALLRIAMHSSAEEVQHAFLRAARRTHPDTLPSTADDATRRSAAQSFDDLVRARAALMTVVGAPVPAAAPVPPAAVVIPPRRGIGGSLVVLALLAFLLVGLVTLEQALRSETAGAPVPAVTP